MWDVGGSSRVVSTLHSLLKIIFNMICVHPFVVFHNKPGREARAARLTNGKPGTGCECPAKVTSSLQRRSPAGLEMSHPGVLLPG